jgi:hypothetical protein
MGEAQHYDPATEQDVHTSGIDIGTPKDGDLAAESGLDNPDVRHKPDSKDLVLRAQVQSSKGSQAMSPDSVFGKRD